jgi:endonuclease/exonuclease/phosphatase family metal-dependent hydrolase
VTTENTENAEMKAEADQAGRFPFRSFRVLRGFLLGVFVVTAVARAETLTVATYNVENYGSVGRMTEAGYRADYPKPEREKTALRGVIRALGADVLVMQEMGDAPYLEELALDLRAEGLDYPHRALLDGPDGERHVAVLSRRPLKRVVPHAFLRFGYLGATESVKRGMLEVAVEAGGGEVTLFAVHLKSRLTERADDPNSEGRRAAESGAVRDRILQRLPSLSSPRYVVAGDFNDGPSSRTMERMLARGATVVAALVPAVDSRGETWTYHYPREETYSRFDHVLVSEALRTRVAGGKARIYDGAGVGEGSDHRPVVLTLEF